MGDVRVGIGVMILKEGRVLLGYRTASHGKNTWIMPGGHLEFGESFRDCAIRETKEETGLDVEPERVFSVSNDISYGKHYVTIGIMAKYVSGEPKVMEPDKYREWKWFSLEELPSDLSDYNKKQLENLKMDRITPDL
jgi:8-oxo-dGTP diphosphatase